MLLRMRFNLALYADPRHFDSQVGDYGESRRLVDDVGSPLLTAQTVKFFADGVVENETGALLQPYCSGLHSHGMRNWEGDSLAEAARRVDELGLQIHIHAIGDAAVRQALDAIEYVVRATGNVIADRLSRTANWSTTPTSAGSDELGVIPNMQPLWAQMDALMTVLTVPRLGVERSDRQYQMQNSGHFGCTAVARLGLAGVLGSAIGRASRSGCRGGRRTANRRAAGHRTRSYRSSARCRRTPQESRIRPSRRTIGAGSHRAPAPTCSGWTATPVPPPRSNFPLSGCAPPTCTANRHIRPPTERQRHDCAYQCFGRQPTCSRNTRAT